MYRAPSGMGLQFAPRDHRNNLDGQVAAFFGQTLDIGVKRMEKKQHSHGCWFLGCSGCEPAIPWNLLSVSARQAAGRSKGLRLKVKLIGAFGRPTCSKSQVVRGKGQGSFGYGLKLKHQGTAGFSPWFHVLGFQNGYPICDPQPFGMGSKMSSELKQECAGATGKHYSGSLPA